MGTLLTKKKWVYFKPYEKERLEMLFKMGLCAQKLIFFSFPAILIGLLKDISLIDILRYSQHTTATIFSLNFKQHVVSALGWSLCIGAISSGWLLEIWSLAPLVL